MCRDYMASIEVYDAGADPGFSVRGGVTNLGGARGHAPPENFEILYRRSCILRLIRSFL